MIWSERPSSFASASGRHLRFSASGWNKEGDNDPSRWMQEGEAMPGSQCSVDFKSLDFSTLRDMCPPSETVDITCCLPLARIVSGLPLDPSIMSETCRNDFFQALSEAGFDPNQLLGVCMPHLAPLVQTGKAFSTKSLPSLPIAGGVSATQVANTAAKAYAKLVNPAEGSLETEGGGGSGSDVVSVLRKTAKKAYTKLGNTAPASLDIIAGLRGSEGGPDVVGRLGKIVKKVYTALGSTALASSSLNIEGGSHSGSSDVAVSSSESGQQVDGGESSLEQGLVSSEASPFIGSHEGSELSQTAPLSSSYDEAALSSLYEDVLQASLGSFASDYIASSESSQGGDSKDGDLASGSGTLYAPSSQSGQHGGSEKKSTEMGAPASEAPLSGSHDSESDKLKPLPKSSGESAPSSSPSSASGQNSSPPSSASGQHGVSAEKSTKGGAPASEAPLSGSDDSESDKSKPLPKPSDKPAASEPSHTESGNNAPSSESGKQGDGKGTPSKGASASQAHDSVSADVSAP
ncbi:hypothetical protein CBR_g52273 [Chara braunii]|uniref:Uncharacterized protein n=1 Tax=Chara braunii TaxID=69332 RepID=A0A388M9Z7_CHABU|nr:hypothetical protein CBR_g52273 [Chara braunii]|eukprot:GBG91386.1 hypothetical protein CBR_g52273 [Chara braunii]